MGTQRIRNELGDLANKPLVEAIFELRWSLDENVDESWELLPGLYYSEVRDQYPHLENLPISKVPAQMAVDIVRHRFRPEKDSWPLIQLGPGVLTVNETGGYTVWEEFLPRIVSAVKALSDVYPEFRIKRAELRYINAVPFDIQSESLIEFLSDKLHLRVEPPELFDGEDTTSMASNAHIQLDFPLKKPKGLGGVSVALGEKDNQPGVIFHLLVRSDRPEVPEDPEKLEVWAGDAHDIIDEWFMTFCEGKLLRQFKETSV